MSMKHPFDAESFYELMDDGTIQVSRGDLLGRFTSEGVFSLEKYESLIRSYVIGL